jgi:hypothetical protein
LPPISILVWRISTGEGEAFVASEIVTVVMENLACFDEKISARHDLARRTKGFAAH